MEYARPLMRSPTAELLKALRFSYAPECMRDRQGLYQPARLLVEGVGLTNRHGLPVPERMFYLSDFTRPEGDPWTEPYAPGGPLSENNHAWRGRRVFAGSIGWIDIP